MTENAHPHPNPQDREPRRSTPRRRLPLTLGMATVIGLSAVALSPTDAIAAPSSTEFAADVAAPGFDAAEYDDALQRLRANHPWAFDDDGSTVAGDAVAVDWAEQLGKAVFKNVAGLGFDAYLDLVFGENRPGRPLGQISDSLNAIRHQVAKIEEAIKRLQESVDRNAFISAEGWAKTYARDIQSQVKLIDGWEGGHAYTSADVQDMVNVSYKAIEQLEVHLLGPFGSQSMLTKLLGHGDRNAAYDQLDTYRAGYRAPLATGLLSLEWAAEQDAKHLNQLEVAQATAHPTAEALYDIGNITGSLTISGATRITRSSGQTIAPNHILGNVGHGRGVAFDVGDRLPTTMTKDGRMKFLYNRTATNYFWLDVGSLNLTVDHYTGAVTGSAGGSMTEVIPGAPYDHNWHWHTSSVTGTVDKHGSGQVALDVPIQNVTGSGGTPFTNIRLVLDAA